ncbi:unnamed protein product [Aureobasidium mustum]|uniref:Major facilitator superfamily (MFS) profile domain-containing protein n=1 Tax=Aureobasidium mustum TaxID=2773714 RepID=A0A9N8JYH5_9PEZI|nr:unnamed protein product [Aureobasidium mustum]
MAAHQHHLETQSSHSSFQDTVMGSKPDLLRAEQGEKHGMFDEEKGAVATAERPTFGDDGQRDAVATPPPAFDPRDNPDGGRDACVMPTWFFKKRAAAFGIMAAGSSTGGAIFPIMVNKLIPRIGFGWTMRVCGFLVLALMLVANATVKSRLPPRPKPFHIMQFIRPLKETPYLLTVLGSFFFFFAMFLPINYLILQAQTLGMSSRLAEYLVPILNGASFFGRVLPGVAADKIGRYNVMTIMMAFAGILILALWLPAASNAPIIVFAALYGFGSGSFVSLAPSLVAQISDVREIGVRNGTVFAIISFAALCSNPIGGALITRWEGEYTGLQIFGGIMALSGACTILAARIVLAGTKIAAKV